jgi:hypothetical protein
MARNDEEAPWPRQLLVAVVVLVAVALVIGGVASVVALGAAKVTGINDAHPTATARPSLYLPSGDPTTKVDPYPAPSGGRTPGPTARSATPSPKPKPKPKHPAFSLRATPPRVAAGERITLSGSYPGHDGARITVQRFESDWVDFPVTATVHGGAFSTYITTSHTGVNRLRMTDVTADRSSNAVRVTVG